MEEVGEERAVPAINNLSIEEHFDSYTTLFSSLEVKKTTLMTTNRQKFDSVVVISAVASNVSSELKIPARGMTGYLGAEEDYPHIQLALEVKCSFLGSDPNYIVQSQWKK